MKRITLYCTCGDSAQVAGNPDAKVDAVRAAWDQVHTGPGHAPCDRNTAANARRRQERSEDRRANGRE